LSFVGVVLLESHALKKSIAAISKNRNFFIKASSFQKLNLDSIA